MRGMLQKIRGAIARAVPRRDHVRVDGSIIPAPDRRWCGTEFRDDAFYLESARREARRLRDQLQCTPQSSVLDVGCGQGRLAIGLLREVGALAYTGIDIHRPSIDWCHRHIQRHHASYRFLHLDVRNERYNPAGAALDDAFRFPLDDHTVDIVYLYSVFSHMTEQDMRVYLREFAHVLHPDGRVWLTGFIEEDVPDVSINPPDYRVTCSGPLHVVRYERQYLFGVFEAHGFTVLAYDHGTEADCQSAVCLVRSDDA
jgi:ubiquinone/menaquinone biosynthesis C-methylase UbiE